jgi:exodeoxyribonuclease VII small subunit
MESFEHQLQRLETIVEILDQGKEPIGTLLELYEEGMTIAHNCRAYLEKAEQKVIEIRQNHDPVF